MRVVTNRKFSEKHYRRIEQFAPKTRTVKLLRLTEKQYRNIYAIGRGRLSREDGWYQLSYSVIT